MAIWNQSNKSNGHDGLDNRQLNDEHDGPDNSDSEASIFWKRLSKEPSFSMKQDSLSGN